jgi:hypothetical protein
MLRKLTVRFALACGLTLAVGSLAFAAENWVGTWKLNAAKSKYSPGPAPKSQTLKFERSQGGIKLTSDAIDAQGKALHGEYVSKFDGQDVPWTGNPDADTAGAKRIDDNSYENVWKKAGKVTMTARITVSADGKTLTVTQTGKDSQGRSVNTTAVYDKQ